MLDTLAPSFRPRSSLRISMASLLWLSAVATPFGRAQQPGPAQTGTPTSSAAAPAAAPSSGQGNAGKPAASTGRKKGKSDYTGPTAVVVLPPTPMLDPEGKQRVDTDGKPMFNLPVKQIRDKKGHPVFDNDGKPLFQTASSLGYDEKGKKIPKKKVKSPKTTPLSISNGTLTVDGWTGKARLNYDIADLQFLYIYAPGLGATIVSHNPFPGATEQAGAFNDTTLHITVGGHPIEVSSDKRLLGKKPEAAWVAVDRSFQLPSKFPVFGYGALNRSPYAWPGSKESSFGGGAVTPPPLPADVRPALLLGPCPAGMMRPAGPVVLPGHKAEVQPCAPINGGASTGPAKPIGSATQGAR